MHDTTTTPSEWIWNSRSGIRVHTSKASRSGCRLSIEGLRSFQRAPTIRTQSVRFVVCKLRFASKQPKAVAARKSLRCGSPKLQYLPYLGTVTRYRIQYQVILDTNEDEESKEVVETVLKGCHTVRYIRARMCQRRNATSKDSRRMTIPTGKKNRFNVLHEKGVHFLTR
jgi:hypothetical protein